MKQETRIDIHGHRTIDPFHEVAQNEEALVQNKIERQTAPLQLLGNFTCSSSSAQLIFLKNVQLNNFQKIKTKFIRIY